MSCKDFIKSIYAEFGFCPFIATSPQGNQVQKNWKSEWNDEAHKVIVTPITKMEKNENRKNT